MNIMNGLFWNDTNHSILKFVRESKNGDFQKLQAKLQHVATCGMPYGTDKKLYVHCMPKQLVPWPPWRDACWMLLKEFFDLYKSDGVEVSNDRISDAQKFCGPSTSTFTRLNKNTLIITGRAVEVDQKVLLIKKMLTKDVQGNEVEQFSWNNTNKSFLLFLYLKPPSKKQFQDALKGYADVDVEQGENNILTIKVSKRSGFVGGNWQNQTISCMKEYFKTLATRAIDELSEEIFKTNRDLIEDVSDDCGDFYVYWSKNAKKTIICGIVTDIDTAKKKIVKNVNDNIQNGSKYQKGNEVEQFSWNNTNKSFLLFLHLKPTSKKQFQDALKRYADVDVEQGENNILTVKVSKRSGFVGGNWQNQTISCMKEYFKTLATRTIDELSEEIFETNQALIEDVSNDCGDFYVYWSKNAKKAIICGIVADIDTAKKKIVKNVNDNIQNGSKYQKKHLEEENESSFVWEDVKKSFVMFLNVRKQQFRNLQDVLEDFAFVELVQQQQQNCFELKLTKKDRFIGSAWKTKTILQLRLFFKDLSFEFIDEMSQEYFTQNRKSIEEITDEKGTTFVYWSPKKSKAIISGLANAIPAVKRKLIEQVYSDELYPTKPSTSMTNSESEFFWSNTKTSTFLFLYNRKEHLEKLQFMLRNHAFVELITNKDSPFQLKLIRKSTYHDCTWRQETVNQLELFFKDYSSDVVDQMNYGTFNAKKMEINQLAKPDAFLYWNRKDNTAIICGFTFNIPKVKDDIQKMLCNSRPRSRPPSRSQGNFGTPRKPKRSTSEDKTQVTITWNAVSKSIITFVKMKSEYFEKLKKEMLETVNANVTIEQKNNHEMIKISSLNAVAPNKFKDEATRQVVSFFKDFSTQKLDCTKDQFDAMQSFPECSSDSYTHVKYVGRNILLCGKSDKVIEKAQSIKELMTIETSKPVTLSDELKVEAMLEYCKKAPEFKDVVVNQCDLGMLIKGTTLCVLEAEKKIEALICETILHCKFNAFKVLETSHASLMVEDSVIKMQKSNPTLKLANDLQQKPVAPPKPAISSKGAMKINVIQGDLTQQNCECIVRSTDDSFAFGGQVSKLILAKGGDGVKAACEGGVVTNKCILSNAGKLPCKNILHVALAGSIKESIHNILNHACKEKLGDLHIPVIGSGNYGSTFQVCINDIKNGIEEWSKTNTDSNLQLTIVLAPNISTTDKKTAEDLFKDGITRSQPLPQPVVRGMVFGSVNVTICSKDQKTVQKVHQKVCETLNFQIKTIILPIPSNIKLKPSDVKGIEAIGDKIQVGLSLYQHKEIEISGERKNVSLAETEINGYLKKLKAEIEENTLPEYWDMMHFSEAKKIIVDRDSEEYKKIEVVFLSSGNQRPYKIKRIERIQNLTLWKQFETHKKKVKAKTKKNDVERLLFHGTSAESIKKISHSGFDKAFAGKNGTVYGKGVYFSSDVNYSHNYANPNFINEHSVIVSRVIVGRYCRGNSSMLETPVLPNEELEKYDSVVDNETSPSIFVVFRDWSVYPSYVVTYSA